MLLVALKTEWVTWKYQMLRLVNNVLINQAQTLLLPTNLSGCHWFWRPRNCFVSSFTFKSNFLFRENNWKKSRDEPRAIFDVKSPRCLRHAAMKGLWFTAALEIEPFNSLNNTWVAIIELILHYQQQEQGYNAFPLAFPIIFWNCTPTDECIAQEWLWRAIFVGNLWKPPSFWIISS